MRVLIFSVLVPVSMTAAAHDGLNSEGCHNNRKPVTIIVTAEHHRPLRRSPSGLWAAVPSIETARTFRRDLTSPLFLIANLAALRNRHPETWLETEWPRINQPGLLIVVPRRHSYHIAQAIKWSEGQYRLTLPRHRFNRSNGFSGEKLILALITQ